MGGKGQRRREKNYRAAHGDGGGGYSRLPPPPKTSEIDALPSKLRRLIDVTNNPPTQKRKVSNDVDNKKTHNKKQKIKTDVVKQREKVESSSKTNNKLKEEGEISDEEITDKEKEKKKKKHVKDLRFDTIKELGGSYGSKKRERRKKYLETKKKKHRKGKIGEGQEFPGHEDIQFGDIVVAPPKLLALPKPLKKKVQDASHERLRLQAVEAYRKRKGWESRPGLHLPPMLPSSPV
ncbi:hypothetical protein IFM89_014023 [Coptis chinensis]|uniref:Uncharacterized protein n=1 Tax=Coptis chinensis TaxID=261450 RepID=A0A835LZE9_9MAGN|nr:hypothetical protein IFM89_014023 [Coptis chinensis]